MTVLQLLWRDTLQWHKIVRHAAKLRRDNTVLRNELGKVRDESAMWEAVAKDSQSRINKESAKAHLYEQLYDNVSEQRALLRSTVAHLTNQLLDRFRKSE